MAGYRKGTRGYAIHSPVMRQQDINKTVEFLSKFEPGFLPYPVFEQIARLVALPIIEFIPLRQHNKGVEVLLIRRPDSDPLWPNELHTPGTVIRATDSVVEGEKWSAFERILREEMNDTLVGDPHYVGSIMHKSKRGTEQAQVYWLEVLGEAMAGKFYPIDNLPKQFMDSQRNFVAQAAKSYITYLSV